MSNTNLYITFFLVVNSFILLGQKSTTVFINELQEKIGSSWTAQIDTTGSDSIHNHLSYFIKSGTIIGTVNLTHKKSGAITFLLYYSKYDSAIIQEIGIYLNHASCAAEKGQPSSYYLESNNFYFFLPMYPCWGNGYGKRSKKLILKLYEKPQKKPDWL